VQDHVLENLETLLAEPGGGEEKSPAPPLLGLPGLHPGRAPDPTARYQVHVLVTHGDQQSAPVVFETNPTYANLFGRLDQSAQVTDPAESIAFLSPGALHRASGGYLILQMEDLLKYPAVWDTLKRSLLTREVAIQAVPDQPRLMGGPLLRPEPVPIAVKVILIGGSDVYAFLWSRDETFRKLFKVKVEFDPILEWNAETLRAYLSFLGTRCRQEGLPHLDRGGVGLLIEYAARLAEDQRKISAQFNQVLEVLYEASALAQADQAEHVTETHVAQAIRDKRARSALVEERFQEMIGRGHLLIGVDGSAVGQVNGLSVYTLGEFSFGVPSRVTARIWMGRRGIVHIEKETMMSGQIHNKGVLTLSGFFGERFAQDKPLSVSASLSFEQLYGGVEGDSASSTELFALLSAIAEAPIDQGIGVTGSVNQAGEIQPVGGVNQKVEGFFRTCRTKGLTGRQGVILPIQNVENLMLDREVVEAVRAGQFHVWAVSTVEEGIEILTGIPAGVRQPDGQYPPDTIFGRVDRRLRSMAEGLRAFDGPSA
jgi:predicted ATP-dependent protease